MEKALVSKDGGTNFLEGWTLYQIHPNKKWKHCWSVLQQKRLLLLTSNQISSQVLIHVFCIDSDTEARVEPSKTGFSLRISSCHASTDTVTCFFKFECLNDRDLWRSFILGISKGFIPNDVELLPGQRNSIIEIVQNIRKDVFHSQSQGLLLNPKSSLGVIKKPSDCMFSDAHDEQRTDVLPKDNGIDDLGIIREARFENFKMLKTLEQLKNRQIELSRKELSSEDQVPTGSIDDDDDDDDDDEMVQESKRPDQQKSLDSLLSKSSDEFQSRECSNDMLSHPFCAKSGSKKCHLPKWFVDCSREEAEDLLLKSQKQGNVLMRKSSSFATTGKYVISLKRDCNGIPTVSHYTIARCNKGYKIDVKNEHRAMSSLSEVMQFFITVMGSGSRPLSFGSHDLLPAGNARPCQSSALFSAPVHLT